MEERLLKDAVEDISLIKAMIEKTRKSFLGFSKIFIGWGLMYLGVSLLHMIANMHPEATRSFYSDHQLVVYLVPMLLIALAVFIYHKVSKKQPLNGLERHLMVLWGLILLLLMIPIRVELMSEATGAYEYTLVTVNNFSTSMFSLGIALAMTSALTEIKVFKYMATGYMIYGFLFAYFHIGLLDDLSVPVSLIILPGTLLFTGIYLKHYQGRSHGDGDPINS